ncbi:MAG: BamA/TamA family outer membrane protein [Candidatus Marinimicrobia bacterium]|nr:BamA/TamA family outer membrane protein [Candidatus Neomarinimicrobiota bacterium]
MRKLIVGIFVLTFVLFAQEENEITFEQMLNDTTLDTTSDELIAQSEDDSTKEKSGGFFKRLFSKKKKDDTETDVNEDEVVEVPESSEVVETVTKTEEAKTGLSFGALPAVAYDTDTGFRYGALANIYDYGDGSTYPEYLWSLYVEWSRTTKGSGNNVVFFDSKHLLPKGIRVTADLSYLTEQTLDFYGFNGYESDYNSDYIVDDNSDYITRVYYKYQRKLFRFTSDFQGKLFSDKLLWTGGVGHFDNNISSVDIDQLNEGQSGSDVLPSTVPTLFEEYIGVDNMIKIDQKNGGFTNLAKIGVIYDTRDNQANPMSGMWSELLFIVAPDFLGNDYPYSQMILSHRQYFTIIPRNLSFAYRLTYQGKLTGEMPFYMLPYMMSSYKTVDGLGGKKTIRGILRNRIMSDGVAYGNFEVRWKFFRTVLFGQNIYLGVNPFVDMGITVSRYDDFNTPFPPIPEEKDALHIGYGAGFKIAMNENFIISVDYGRAVNEQDGNSGLYIGLDYLF